MAAFTALDADALLPIFQRLFVAPEILSLQQISDGIENSNYLVSVEASGLRGRVISGVPSLAGMPCSGTSFRVIVTIIEMLEHEALQVIVDAVTRMASAGLSVPGVFADEVGDSIFSHARKPLLVVPMLEGRGLQPGEVQAGHCRQIGRFLGALHALPVIVPGQTRVERDFRWTLDALSTCERWTEPDETAELSRVREQLAAVLPRLETLPKCWTHGDLFIDNALFHAGSGTTLAPTKRVPGDLSGVIDFYRSGIDSAALDLAIAANDWCWCGEQFVSDRMDALMAGYASERTLSADELELWPALLGFAAARFYAARMFSLHTASYQREAAQADPSAASVLKDPSAMQRRMQHALLRF